MSLCRVIIGVIATLSICDAVASAQLKLIEQAKIMPDEFKSYLFNSPLSARVTLDGQTLGDAMVMLMEDNSVRIINFTSGGETTTSESIRQHWLKAFSEPVLLGKCQATCPPGLTAVDYNLNEAVLTLISEQSGHESQNYWYSLPEEGDLGLIFNNQLNTSGSRDQSTLSWNGGIDAALGNWSLSSQLQHDQTRYAGEQTVSRHAMTSLYAQREFQQTSLRAGLFMPDSQGLLRQPYMPRGGVSTLTGMMFASSDARRKDTGTPALYPIYVTANREGIAEVYRDGTLINSQPIVPGLQVLDTTSLPSGIYEVEIRIIEDGRESSRTNETVNKPYAWRNPGQRVRYNIFAGKQQTLWNTDKQANDGELAAGASFNYLLYPRATVGLAAQKTGSEQQLGGNIDWQPTDQLQLYSNLWRSNVTGYGLDSQGVWTFTSGNVALSYNRSWYRPEDEYFSNSDYHPRSFQEYTSTLSSTFRFNAENSINGRLTHSSRNSGLGIDIGFNTRTYIAGHSINWRLSGFDRPYGDSSSLRNRGMTINASFSLGSDKRSGNLSFGSRTDTGGSRDLYTSASVNQEWGDDHFIKSTTGSLTADRHGVGLSTYNQFDSSLAQGNFWGQRSSLDGLISGGANFGSMLAIGGGKTVLTKSGSVYQGGGVIVDVDSDDASARLVAISPGSSYLIHPGRNFIPVEAWKPGTIQLDFSGVEVPALKIEPEYLDYQHIRGGVSTYNVRVMKTVTVMGRLIDMNGTPLGGAQVINHAGRTVSESDGLFTLEMQESNPVLTVEHHSGIECAIKIDRESQKNEDIIFVGNLKCGVNGKVANANEGLTSAGQEGNNV